jgi:hypothetical protein
MSSRAEDDAATRLRQTGEAIVTAVDDLGASYLEREAMRVIDAWDRLDVGERAGIGQDLRDAARRATRRVTEELRALASQPAGAQAMTPLEVVRTLPREPTEVLVSAGIPALVREPFEERAWPDDRYGLVPRSLADLGDPDLGPLYLAWGMAKARLLRTRDSSRTT